SGADAGALQGARAVDARARGAAFLWLHDGRRARAGRMAGRGEAMRIWLLATAMVAMSGCAYTIEAAHRGMIVNARRRGLQDDVVGPGRCIVGVYGRMEDFDVTYSTREEGLHTIDVDGLAMDVKVALSYRPVVSELYDLDVEIGPKYYDEVVGPEFRTATR